MRDLALSIFPNRRDWASGVKRFGPPHASR